MHQLAMYVNNMAMQAAELGKNGTAVEARKRQAFTVKAVWLRETSTWQRCCVSAELYEKLRGMRNCNPAFAVGSKNLRASSYKDHATTDMHK